MEGSFDRDVRPYLDLINSLRQVGIHQEISLPQIAVMGDQVTILFSSYYTIVGMCFDLENVPARISINELSV